MEIFFIYFLKLDHFLRTFCKKCIFTIENPKNYKIFQKMTKLLLDKQIFASSDAITATTCKILSTTRAILALTWFCHLSIYLWSLGGAWGAPMGDPPLPLYMKKFSISNIDFLGHPRKWNFPHYFFNPFSKLSTPLGGIGGPVGSNFHLFWFFVCIIFNPV